MKVFVPWFFNIAEVLSNKPYNIPWNRFIPKFCVSESVELNSNKFHSVQLAVIKDTC